MTNLDKLIADFKEARYKASFGEWVEQQRSLANHKDPYIFDRSTGALFQPIGGKFSFDSIDFVCLAANNSDKLIRILEVMGVALKQISENKKLTIMNESDDFMEGAHAGYVRQAEEADEALQQAEKIAGEV